MKQIPAKAIIVVVILVVWMILTHHLRPQQYLIKDGATNAILVSQSLGAAVMFAGLKIAVILHPYRPHRCYWRVQIH